MKNMKQNWSREEHVLAFNLYSQIPFGTIHVRNPKIQKLAKLLGRTAGAVSYKLANFARLDPALKARGIRGMPHGAKGEEEVWREFARDPEALAFESEQLLASRLHKPVEEVAEIKTEDLPHTGLEREAVLRVRVNQAFFRRRILSAYEFRCCVTGLMIQQLLVASHIVGWAEDKANRLNPRNGLCLNALHDRAFDARLMWIDDNYKVRFTDTAKEASGASKATTDWLTQFEGARLLLPASFVPDPNFLRSHALRCRDRNKES
jgi:putative restriction endonuclease